MGGKQTKQNPRFLSDLDLSVAVAMGTIKRSSLDAATRARVENFMLQHKDSVMYLALQRMGQI